MSNQYTIVVEEVINDVTVTIQPQIQASEGQGAPSGDVNWGDIGGNLTDQTDLNSRLSAKAEQSSLDATNSNVSTNSSDISTNAAAISSNDTDIVALDLRLNIAEGAITQNGTDISNNTSSISQRIGDAPNDGTKYVRQNESWVEETSSSGLTDAPSDGNTYGRNNGSWTLIASSNTLPYILADSYGTTAANVETAYNDYKADATKSYLYFPPGNYTINQRMLFTDRTDITIRGDAAILQITNDINDSTKAVGCGIYLGRATDFTVERVLIENMIFDFQGLSANEAVAVFLGNPRGEVKFVNCKFINFGSNLQQGVHCNSVGEDTDEPGFGYSPGLTFENCTWYNRFTLSETSYNYSSPDAVGLGIDFQNTTEFSRIINCTFWGVGKAAEYYEGANASILGSHFLFCDPGDNTSGVINVPNGGTTNNGKLTISDCHFKHNKRFSIFCDYNTTEERGLFIHDNQFIANNWTPIVIQNMDKNKIHNNYFNRANLHTLAQNSPFSGNGNAIELTGSHDNFVMGNTFFDGINYPIYGSGNNNFYTKNIEHTCDNAGTYISGTNNDLVDNKVI